MKPKLLIPILLLWMLLPLGAQNVVLTGQVTDAQTGEPMIGVTVYHTQRRTGTTTNGTGHYTITLPSNRQMELVFSYVGYASEIRELTLKSDQVLNIQLNPSAEPAGCCTYRTQKRRLSLGTNYACPTTECLFV